MIETVEGEDSFESARLVLGDRARPVALRTMEERPEEERSSSPRGRRALAVLTGLVALLASCGPPTREPAGGATSSAAAAVPLDLARTARRFGLKMLADGFTWQAIDPKATRFEWSGRTASGDREILYSFWLPKLQAAEAKLLPQLVSSATANLAVGQPCQPHEQPKDFVDLLGVDRVVSACFEPSPFYAKEFHHGILHGIVNDGSLTIVVVLSNDLAAAIVPLPKSIGARGN